jgi:uncharacterized protein YcgI (DUF1989 family)
MDVSISRAEIVEIAPCSGTAFRLGAGSVLHVIDPQGEQVSDLVAFSAEDAREALSNGRTFDYLSTIRLGLGSVLYSNRSVPLFTIVHDDVGVHDFLLAPCSRDTWRICYGDATDVRPGCFGNLSTALAPFGVGPDAIPTAFNLFMNVVHDASGRLEVRPGKSLPGDRIALRAERDLIVGLTACSAPLSNNGRYKPIHFAIQVSSQVDG